MKKSPILLLSIVVLFIIVLFVFMMMMGSCTDTGMETINTQNNSDQPAITNTTDDMRTTNYFTKTVGAPIDLEKAKRWIRNFETVNSRSFEYNIQSEVLKEILAQPNCNGITLRYGLDALNQLHIIPVGVDNTGTEMKAERVATSFGYISWAQGKELTNNYKGAIRSHFFGANTFARLFRDGNCKVMKATAALNENNEPQLLLTNGSSTESKVVEDDSFPCPALCESMQN